jgi:hypothetical protein
VNPQGGKVARAYATQPLFEAGNVWLPDPSLAPWIGEYVEELCGFPTAAHDDEVDATTQALTWLEGRRWSGGRNILEFYLQQRAAKVPAETAAAPVSVVPRLAELERPRQPAGKFSSFAAAIAAGCVPQQAMAFERKPPVLIPDPDRPGAFIQRFDLQGPGDSPKR